LFGWLVHLLTSLFQHPQLTLLNRDIFVQEDDPYLQATLGAVFSDTPKELDCMNLANQPPLPLLSIKKLRKCLNDSPPFSLELFLPKLHKLIRSCLHDVFPRRPLLDNCYLDPTEEQEKGHIEGEDEEVQQDGKAETRERRAHKSRRRSVRDEIVDSDASEKSKDDGKAAGKTFNHVKNLRQKRTALTDASNDPLQESLKIAHRAVAGMSEKRTRSPSAGNRQAKKIRRDGSGLLAKKASASRLHFDSGEDSENDGPNLSELPQQKSPRLKSPRKKSQMKKYDGRRLWTEEEKGAIKDGILSMGVGHWAQIKEEYPILLCDRTSMQIKVCRIVIPVSPSKIQHLH
jgi:hypothetical protein